MANRAQSSRANTMTTERRRCVGNFMVLVIMSGTVQVKRVFWPSRSGPSGSKPVLCARLAVTIQNNHRWTQIDTDKTYSKPCFSMARIPSPDRDPKQSEARPESTLQNLCSSVSICGFLLHGYSLASGSSTVGHPGRWHFGFLEGRGVLFRSE